MDKPMTITTSAPLMLAGIRETSDHHHTVDRAAFERLAGRWQFSWGMEIHYAVHQS